MRQISAKLNTYVRNIDIINNDLERFTFNFILVSFGALAFLYVIFLGNMVSSIIERRSLENNMRALSSEVKNLELEYLSISNNVDLTLSYSLGFKETKKTFTTRKPFTLRTSDGSLDSIKIVKNEI